MVVFMLLAFPHWDVVGVVPLPAVRVFLQAVGTPCLKSSSLLSEKGWRLEVCMGSGIA